jgi:hypothetical protein
MVKLSFDTLPCVGTGAYREYIATLEACLNRSSPKESTL